MKQGNERGKENEREENEDNDYWNDRLNCVAKPCI